MMRFIAEMLKLPLTAFVYSMEMLVRTMQGLQRIGDRGIDSFVSGSPQISVAEPEPENGTKQDEAVADRVIGDSTETTVKEETKMSDIDDKDLSGDDLKLVRYKILFIKRDHEHAFPEREDLVSADIGESGFTAWKIAEFIQRLNETPVPDKWKAKGYPPGGGGRHIDRLPEDDKQYLRIFYQVLDRFPREEANYEASQIKVLEQIRDELARRPPVPPGAGEPASPVEATGGEGAGRSRGR